MGKRRISGLIIIALAAGAVTAGIMRGEVLDVFNKAIRICLECIGIG